jgi:hypothetical protein
LTAAGEVEDLRGGLSNLVPVDLVVHVVVDELRSRDADDLRSTDAAAVSTLAALDGESHHSATVRLFNAVR